MKMVLTWPDKRLGCFKAGFIQEIENALLNPLEKQIGDFTKESESEKEQQLQSLANLLEHGLKKVGRRNANSYE